MPDAYRDASPLAWVDAETVPFLIIHSATDTSEPVAQARAMSEALHQAGVDCVSIELASGGHEGPNWWLMSGPWVVTFLSMYLHPKR